MLKKYLLLICLFPFLLPATEHQPWYDEDLEGHLRSTINYQHFRKLATTHGKRRYSSNDCFLTESLGLSYDTYAIEAEITAAATRKQHFNIDHLKITGRYQILNDILDDPFSLVAGFSLIQAGQPALYDPASFHHGRVEAECHVSIGKEISSIQYWQRRYFASLGLGLSQGSPWIRTDFVYAQNCYDFQRLELFLHTLFGLGGQSLKLNSFHGYGNIRHQSVDLGLNYAHFIERLGGTLTAGFSYRVYAKNFPKNSSRLMLSFYYPFGLRI